MNTLSTDVAFKLRKAKMILVTHIHTHTHTHTYIYIPLYHYNDDDFCAHGRLNGPSDLQR